MADAPESEAKPNTQALDDAMRGAVAGACAGLLLGAVEACWIVLNTRDLFELGLLVWGPFLTASLCALLGIAVGVIAGRFGASPAGAAMGALFFAAGPTLARYRVLIDFKTAIERDAVSHGSIFLASLVAGLALGAVGWVLASRLSRGRLVAFASFFAVAILGFGWLASSPQTPRVYDGVRKVETANLSKRNALHGVERPDIILIVADTLRADFLSSYDARSPARTTAIDALAADGIRFPHACAQSSWTKPSFATLITGLHPRTHTAASKTAVLPSEITTLGEALRDAGYYTVGTSNANPNNASWANFDQGFTEWYDFYPGFAWWDVPWSTTHTIVYQRVVERLMRIGNGYRVHHFYQPADDITNWALRWLGEWKRPQNVPLFLSLHYMDPHQPHLGGREVGPMLNRTWRMTGDDMPTLETMLEGYAGDIEAMDRGLEKLFEGLRQLGIYDDAIVVFTSDHGQEFLEHESWGHGESLYAEQLNVPLIVKLPQARAAGSTPQTLARQLDVAATVLELAGVEVPEAMQGIALLAPSGEVASPGAAHCFASLEREEIRAEAVQNREATFIESVVDGPNPAPTSEFFDLARDPLQQENLTGRGDPREAALARILGERVAEVDATRLEKSQVELDAGLEAQLRALGYVE